MSMAAVPSKLTVPDPNPHFTTGKIQTEATAPSNNTVGRTWDDAEVWIVKMQAHQAAMDEKVAEVANLTLRLREMSGKVMWHEIQLGESATLADSFKKMAQAAEARVMEVELEGVRLKPPPYRSRPGFEKLYIICQY